MLQRLNKLLLNLFYVRKVLIERLLDISDRRKIGDKKNGDLFKHHFSQVLNCFQHEIE